MGLWVAILSDLLGGLMGTELSCGLLDLQYPLGPVTGETGDKEPQGGMWSRREACGAAGRHVKPQGHIEGYGGT